jgi:hypothetical protein
MKKNGKKVRLQHTYRNSWRLFINELTKDQIQSIKTIPGFDPDVFFEITGQKI